MRNHWWSVCLLVLVLLVVRPRICPAVGGVADLVFDPNNYQINILTQANTLRSTINDATQIAQKARSLIMEAQHLVQQPLNMVAEIQSTMSTYTNVLNQARMIGYNITSVTSQFENVFSTGGWGVGDMLRKAQGMQNAIRQAGWTASQTQAIFEQLCLQATNASRAANAAASAPGTVAALQANAQLSYVMSQQLASLQEQAAAADRVQTGFIMMQVTEREQAQIRSEHFFDGFGMQGFKGPKEGQGIVLP